MIKKLRRKFVFINASLIFLVFLSILCAYTYSMYYKREQEGYNQLQMVLERGYAVGDAQMSGSNRTEQRNIAPGFCVKIDKQGRVILTGIQHYTEISTDMMGDAIQVASEAKKDQGTINHLQLRYVRMHTDSGLRIAFADISTELDQHRSYIGIGVVILVSGLGVVLLLAWLLAVVSIRPVEQAWERQSQFVADASHEIKTPLTIILAHTGLLLAGENQIPNQRKWVEHIRTEAERMKELVENMLFLAKSDEGREPLIMDEVNMSELVLQSTLPFEAVAYEKGFGIVTEIDEGIQLWGNARELEHLLLILLDNACKHSLQGGEIRVSLHGTELSVNNASATMIPKEKLSRIFDRFYRADEARDRETGGYGLGLAIAKAIAEQHGGKIRAESTPETGVTMIVDFGRNYKLRNKSSE
ncbi:MAG: two-component sensor histidine kinase [Clostridia bacterium]|nr:two-component sensor histidine kinase [Clostridia bacterium]